MAKTKQERLDYIYNWMKNNPEKVAATRKKYKQKHKEKLRQKDRERYPTIKDSKNEKRRNRRRASPSFSGQVWVWRADVVAKDPVGYAASIKDGRRSHYLNNRDRLLGEMHERLRNMRLEAIYWYSGGDMKCAICGETHIEFLALDHIENDGKQDRALHKGNILNHIVRSGFPVGYQVLCNNCNMLKQFETYKRSNPDAAYHRYRDRIKIEMVKKYSGGTSTCVCCGESRLRCLTFHHINGGGTKHMKSLKDRSLPKFLMKNSPPLDEFSVLCANCNYSLGHYNYCPHQKN